MDKRVLRERMRQKKRQLFIRKMMRLGFCVAAVIVVMVFLVRGVFMPLVGKIGGNNNSSKTVEVQAQAQNSGPQEAVRQPIRSENDSGKAGVHTVGWQEDENGKWYQNADGTYYANGMIEIDGSTYYFDENGYMQTGWVTIDGKDYKFNENGVWEPDAQRPMIALTFDDGPGQYTDKLLDCLEKYDAKATFFMLGQCIEEYPEIPKRMKELGCELGNHSYSHPQLTSLSYDEISSQFEKTNDLLVKSTGSPATVARTPYGAQDETVCSATGLPCFMWSLDTEDWAKMDADAEYDSVIGHVSDGEIVLMHDIHEPSVEAAIRIIPELINQGYKLVTVSELAEAKGINLEVGKSYSDFWDSTVATLKAEDSSDTEDVSSDDNLESDSDETDSSSDVSSEEETDLSSEDTDTYSSDEDTGYSEEDSGGSSTTDDYGDSSLSDEECEDSGSTG